MSPWVGSTLAPCVPPQCCVVPLRVGALAPGVAAAPLFRPGGAFAPGWSRCQPAGVASGLRFFVSRRQGRRRVRFRLYARTVHGGARGGWACCFSLLQAGACSAPARRVVGDRLGVAWPPRGWSGAGPWCRRARVLVLCVCRGSKAAGAPSARVFSRHGLPVPVDRLREEGGRAFWSPSWGSGAQQASAPRR